DGAGFWLGPGVGLGHRRLKVIDLSEAAGQPMGSEDGAIQVVFNGEIYNFADLRAELTGRGCRFRTRSDTEVIVHGYEVWGDAVVERLDGMFAFVLWDARRHRLLAARDRLGKKPLYWAQVRRPGGPPLFAFGSELKALFPVPGLERGISAPALGRYLSYEYVPPPHTIVAGVNKLDAAQSLVLDLGRTVNAAPEVRRYWDLPFPVEQADWPVEEAAVELRQLLRRAVERRLVADVPLGAFLSGGLDSSTIVALMAELAGADRIKTYSIGFSDETFDETRHARAVASYLHTEHHEERLDPKVLIDELPAVADFLDEPLGDASIIPTYLLCKFTRQHVTVALSGDGGDELFAGYQTFLADAPAHLFDRLPRPLRALAGQVARRMPARTGYFSLDFQLNQFLRGGDVAGPLRHQRWMASFLPEELDGLLLPDVRRAAGNPLADVEARAAVTSARSEMDRLMDFYLRFYLAGDLNVKVDRAAGAVGLEVRAPFLDTDLVTFACQLPASLRLQGWTTKYLLRTAMRGRLPDAILNRGKQGFGVPVARWMRQELAPALRDELAEDKIRREGFFEPAAVRQVLDEHLQGRRDHRKQLWTLFVFERWLARHGPA
ncbi:MAG TPA: asparagine synthase (glutamine-hydrolyzing), partial [Polyangia bacterium]|nr:asparagine synthase (glutamine-hydrolyzing) [Polyangia bacterium]